MTGTPRIDLNADVGESFGSWRMGADEELLPLVSSANVACGFHAGDPSVMRRTLAQCASLGVVVGAVFGLMQMTEETFLWMRSKIAPEEPLTFADLYSPDTAIRFGCYYLHLCMVRYKGDVSTAAAAYHSGWGTVDQLLQIEEHSADGETLQGFPYNQMHHYVNKITACYQIYQRLYAGQ